ncbi:pirin family protein [Spirosoma validum]|uniref:Pirin n=1 Tax=Spirosoma validum TaxID=2771355 RepID=A0A927B474_9BACT|nr:pirin [Spirosoma validum]MBD2755100.1 pirin [Spirosoma validum]
MDTQTQAQIYLADQRGTSQIDHFRSYHNFNFGQYFDESRQPFGALQLLNDDLLKAGHSVRMQVEGNTEVVLIPLVGGLEYKSDVGDGFLETGQAQIFSLTSGMAYEIINPYETEWINYVVIWLANTSPAFSAAFQKFPFDLQTKNELLPLFDENNTKPEQVFCGFIGRYDGREEGIYKVSESQPDQPARGVFVFVLSGAFEVQNRLLHERDGLALLDIQNNVVDFEALSNDALLLLLEVPIHQ